jgi:hypothetical protein
MRHVGIAHLVPDQKVLSIVELTLPSMALVRGCDLGECGSFKRKRFFGFEEVQYQNM